MRIFVVGAGLSGCTIAERLSNKGHTITILEKRDHIGGNCYDYYDENGILMNKYGAHIFHTNSERVRNYVTQFAEWIPWKHAVTGRIDDMYFPIPVNIDTVNVLCHTNITSEDEMKAYLSKTTIHYDTPANSEEVALQRVGPVLYKKIFKDYTFKQWAKYPSELDVSVLERIPVRFNRDAGYFSDTFQALPSRGYTAFVSNMIRNSNIIVRLGVEYTHDMRASYDYVFYTGPIDTYFSSSGHPKLEYRSLRFEIERMDIDYFQTNSVINYPSLAEPFTRIIEYKHFLHQYVPGKTTIVREYSTAEGEPYYPVPTKKNKDLFHMYKILAEKEKGVVFVGRLANYKYYNMDEAILAALEILDTQNF